MHHRGQVGVILILGTNFDAKVVGAAFAAIHHKTVQEGIFWVIFIVHPHKADVANLIGIFGRIQQVNQLLEGIHILRVVLDEIAKESPCLVKFSLRFEGLHDINGGEIIHKSLILHLQE